MKDIEVGKTSRHLYIAGVCCGSILSSFCREIAVRQTSHGFSCSPEVPFDRPWMMSVLMSLGMISALGVFKAWRWYAKDDAVDFKFSMLGFKHQMLILAATLCDVYFSVQATVSAIYVGPSTAVALRFCDIIFITILNRVVMKRMFMTYSILSVLLMFLGLAFVAMAEILNSEHEHSVIWAVFLQLTAQFVSSLKSVIEEQILHGTDIHPMCLCGAEGICQLVIILTMVYPIVYLIPSPYAGFHEDMCDSFLMLFHNKVLTSLVFTYPVISCIFNFSVGGVVQRRNGATFVVLEMANSAIVWVLGLIIHHAFKGNIGVATGIGVEWKKYSPMRVFGTILVILGCLVYIRAVEFPCCDYEEAQVTTIHLAAERSTETDGLDM